MDQQHKPGDAFSPSDKTSPPQPTNDTPTPQTPGRTPDSLPAPDASLDEAQSKSQYSVPEPATQPEKKRKFLGKNKTQTLLIALAAILLLGVVGAFAYIGYYLPNKPENMVGQALLNLLDTETVQFEGNAAISNENGFSPEIAFNGGSNGPANAVALSVDSNIGGMELGVSLRGVDNQLFAQLNGASTIGTLLSGFMGSSDEESTEAINQMLSEIDGQWFVFEDDNIEQQLSVSPQIDEQDKQQLTDALSAHDVFKVVTVHDDETIKDQNARHYTIEFNKEGLKAVADDLEGLTINDTTVTSEQIEEFKSGVDEMDTDELTLDVWVYSSSKQLAKVAMDVEEDSGSTQVELTLFGHNEPFEVEVPEDARSFEEIIGPLFGLQSQLTSGEELGELELN